MFDLNNFSIFVPQTKKNNEKDSIHYRLVEDKVFIEEDMIGKLRFKTAMFEDVLDGGDDCVFVGDKSRQADRYLAAQLGWQTVWRKIIIGLSRLSSGLIPK